MHLEKLILKSLISTRCYKTPPVGTLPLPKAGGQGRDDGFKMGNWRFEISDRQSQAIRNKVVRPERFEPPTPCFVGAHPIFSVVYRYLP